MYGLYEAVFVHEYLVKDALRLQVHQACSRGSGWGAFSLRENN